MEAITPYLTFNGNASEALEFYCKALNGEVVFKQSFGESPMESPESQKGKVIQTFSSLSEGGKVTMELQDTYWSAKFGMLTDRYGFNWMFNHDYKK